MTISPKMKTIIGRTLLIVVYIVLIVVMFFTGRTHTLLVDNKNDPDGTAWRAVNGMEVTVGKEGPVEFMRGDRDKFTVKGQRQKIHIEFFDGTPPVTAVIHIPVGEDTMLLSVPKLLAGIEPYIEPFDQYGQTAERQTAAEEEPAIQGMGF